MVAKTAKSSGKTGAGARGSAKTVAKSSSKANSALKSKVAAKSTPSGNGAKKASAPAAPEKRKSPGMDFIGIFPMRKKTDNKKLDAKKLPTGPVFSQGEYKIGSRTSPLAKIQADEFQGVFLGKHVADKIDWQGVVTSGDNGTVPPGANMKTLFTRELDDALLRGEIDIAVHSMKDIPLDLPEPLILAAALRREDPRDALVTNSTYGAIQELPHRARVGSNSKRRSMQIRNLRPDIEMVPIRGNVETRLKKLEAENLDAVVVAWSGLRRLNIAPRFYVALQPEQLIPAPCQGIIGVVCRKADAELVNKLRYIEDSEAAWAARCERAFLQKLGGSCDVPVGAFAHRKGTQDPWILDSVIGDPNTGELLKHREIGTSRCKPESLADKAFNGIMAKGARKFLNF